MIVQQREREANLIKLPLHVHSHHSWDTPAYLHRRAGSADHFARVSLRMADRNRWRDSFVRKRVRMARESVGAIAILHLATCFPLQTIAIVPRRWNGVGIRVEHCFAFACNHHHLGRAQ